MRDLANVMVVWSSVLRGENDTYIGKTTNILNGYVLNIEGMSLFYEN